jgi:hypothetical protein
MSSTFGGFFVLLAALILAGIALSYWSPIVSCAQVTNASAYTGIPVYTTNAGGSYNSYAGIQIFGRGANAKNNAQSCLLNNYNSPLEYSPFTTDDAIPLKSTSACFCASIYATCLTGQMQYTSSQCSQVVTHFIPTLATEVVLLTLQGIADIAVLYLAAAIVYYPKKASMVTTGHVTEKPFEPAAAYAPSSA